MLKTIALALLVSAPAIAADPPQPPCGSDPKAICHFDLSTADVAVIYQAFENADMKHATWGPVQQEMQAQIQAQLPRQAKSK